MMRKFSLVLIAVLAIPASAAETDYNAIAKKIDVDSAALHAAPKGNPKPECDKPLADGTCPDVVKTSRQLRLSGSSASTSTTTRAVQSTVVKVTPSILNLTFLVGSAELSAAAKAQLAKFAAALANLKSMTPFSIDGHTDSTGLPESNLLLSKARAQSTVDFLAAEGVARSRMAARGFGSTQPLPGRSPENPANRRVEIVAR